MKAKKVTPKKKTLTKKTHIALVLDKSGSMIGCVNETIAGFNSQLEVIRDNMIKGGETTVTLITFNTDTNILQNAVHADSVRNITPETYTPNGGTAMFDAVWNAIESLEKLDDGGEQTAFLVVTISDGEENSSRKIDSKTLAEKIQTLEGTKRWTFGYVGANQDLSKINENLKIAVNNSMNYISTSTGTNVMYTATSASLGNYMSNRSVGATYTANLFNG
jgi:uncharacterized protein YegL